MSNNIENPSVNDVLCGKGNAVANHEGNIRFRKLIEINVIQYDDTVNNGVKKSLVERVRNGVESVNGRFLVEVPGSHMYCEQDPERVTKKIQQAFRDKIKSMNRNQGAGLRSSVGSTTTTTSMNTRPMSNTTSVVVQPVGNMPIPLELNIPSNIPSSGIAYTQAPTAIHEEGSVPPLVHQESLGQYPQRGADMLRMCGSASRNISALTENGNNAGFLPSRATQNYPRAASISPDNATTDMMRTGSRNLSMGGEIPKDYPRAASFSNGANADMMRTGSRNLSNSAESSRNLEPEGVLYPRLPPGVEQYLTPEMLEMLTRGSRNLSTDNEYARNLEPLCFDNYDWNREELLKMISLLHSSKSNGSSMSLDKTSCNKTYEEQTRQLPRLLSILSSKNSSLRDVSERLEDLGSDDLEPLVFDSFRKVWKSNTWKSNDTLGDVSMTSAISLGETAEV